MLSLARTTGIVAKLKRLAIPGRARKPVGRISAFLVPLRLVTVAVVRIVGSSSELPAKPTARRTPSLPKSRLLEPAPLSELKAGRAKASVLLTA